MTLWYRLLVRGFCSVYYLSARDTAEGTSGDAEAPLWGWGWDIAPGGFGDPLPEMSRRLTGHLWSDPSSKQSPSCTHNRDSIIQGSLGQDWENPTVPDGCSFEKGLIFVKLQCKLLFRTYRNLLSEQIMQNLVFQLHSLIQPGFIHSIFFFLSSDIFPQKNTLLDKRRGDEFEKHESSINIPRNLHWPTLPFKASIPSQWQWSLDQLEIW